MPDGSVIISMFHRPGKHCAQLSEAVRFAYIVVLSTSLPLVYQVPVFPISTLPQLFSAGRHIAVIIDSQLALTGSNVFR